MTLGKLCCYTYYTQAEKISVWIPIPIRLRMSASNIRSGASGWARDHVRKPSVGASDDVWERTKIAPRRTRSARPIESAENRIMIA